MSDFPPSEPDSDTLARFRNGDITALAVVFKLYGPRVYRLAKRMLGNQADAEDAAQEIFVRAFERAHRFDGRSGLFTWLYRLAVRHCLNKIKQRKRGKRLEQAASITLQLVQPRTAPSPLEHVRDKEQSEIVDRLLQSLPPHYRACLVLREVEELSYHQIAELLEIPVGTVMSRLSRARHALRAELQRSRESRSASGNNLDTSAVQTLKESSCDDLR